MKRRLLPVVVLATLICAPFSTQAGIFKKSSKPNPAERVPELIVVVKTDKDEHKREAAAEELKQYDPAAFPDIVAVLADVVLTDPSSSVRAEAVDSLAHLRPVTQQAGMALEQVLAKDSSMKVRMQARYSLLQMHWAGYHSAAKEGPIPTKDIPASSKETNPPPLIQMPLKTQQTSTKFGETAPPPLSPAADPPPAPKALPKPKPVVQPPLVPTDPPVLKTPPPSPAPTPPAAPSGDQGPDLTPPPE
ncbi:MAG TPA: HEAT repeat domain-containing protein [Gemmataceae bacterium]|jgi:hypothetical protein